MAFKIFIPLLLLLLLVLLLLLLLLVLLLLLLLQSLFERRLHILSLLEATNMPEQ